MARLWKNGGNGTGKNGNFVPNGPIFLRFFSRFLPSSHIIHTFPTMYFWQFPPIFHFPPFPPISPHSPLFPPILPPFFHFPIFLQVCSVLASSVVANADAFVYHTVGRLHQLIPALAGGTCTSTNKRTQTCTHKYASTTPPPPPAHTHKQTHTPALVPQGLACRACKWGGGVGRRAQLTCTISQLL